MAVEAFVATSPIPSPLNNEGYQVTGISSDSVLGRRWATIANCSHPEWPVFAVPASGAVPPAETQRPLTDKGGRTALVRAGDIVRLWKQESLLRIEIAGVSEENGGLGKTIRVRLLRRNGDGQSIPEQYSGVVRGPSDVEMRP